jgi:hypothetical protein
MAYFGGTGAGKGWNTFNFLISADELEEILLNLKTKLLIFNSRVKNNYQFTSIDTYTAKYKDFLDKIFDGTKYDRKIDWKKASSLYRGLLIDTEILTWQQIEKYPEFKTCNLDRPIPTLSPLCICTNGKSLSLSTMNETGYFGLQLQYPKCYSLDEDKHEILYKTDNELEFSMYMEFTNLVKSISKGYKFEIAVKEIRPNLLISKKILPMVNNHWYLKENHLSIAIPTKK